MTFVGTDNSLCLIQIWDSLYLCRKSREVCLMEVTFKFQEDSESGLAYLGVIL